MKMKNFLTIILSAISLISLHSCQEEVLEFYPEDKITSANFPQDEEDIKMLVNGVYALLRENSIYDEGLFGFGLLDGLTPNGYNWGNLSTTKAGNGQLSSGDQELITFRWTRAYAIISRANYLLEAIDEVEMDEETKSTFIGEAHFLRGLAYSLLVDAYGGVPIILEVISTEEARNLSRASLEETWGQVISDYNIAIENLNIDAPEIGRATKGAALAMKMRAFLYQNKYEQVLGVLEEIEELGKYSLFPSYDGLFEPENENNQEVIFDVQYIQGENNQGSLLNQYNGTGTGSWTRGSRYVPTDHLVNAYERIDGSEGSYFNSEIDLDNPYEGWDPRLEYTVVVPGSYYLEHRFPNYLYPEGAYNHPGNRFKHLSTRKYRIDDDPAAVPPSGQSYINYIVIRYADVILSKAEAIIETGGNIGEAISLINRIRTERNDVDMSPIPTGLSQDEAREILRHERRIEFAMEGLYWSDMRRWDIAKDFYPIELRDHTGGLIETRFPNGYEEHYDLLPIPDSEISLNENLSQNPGW